MKKATKEIKKRKKWKKESMVKAIKAVQTGSSISAASKSFNIPFATLHSRISGKYTEDSKSGPETYLKPEEENELETWLYRMASAGFPVTKQHLLDVVEHIFSEKVKNKEILQSPFINQRPSYQWYKDFMKRHPKLSEKTSQNLSTSRAKITETQIRKWFINTEKYLLEENVLVKEIGPERVFNMDESGFLLVPKKEKVIVRRGDKSVYNKCQSDKECYTALLGGSADGKLLPPMILFNNKRISSIIADNFPEDFIIGKCDTGWMTSEVFYNYIANHFYPWLIENKITFPVLLYVDGHSSHLSKALNDFCFEHQIFLVSLLPNGTHLLQPMDVALFHALKKVYSDEIREYRLENDGQVLTKAYFPSVLKKSLDSLDLSTIFKNGFRKCGLYPFTADNVDYGKLLQNQQIKETVECLPEQDYQSDVNSTLSVLESMMNKDVIEMFKNNKSSEWHGDIKYEELFKLWQSCNKSILNSNEKNISDSNNFNVDHEECQESMDISNDDQLNLNINDEVNEVSVNISIIDKSSENTELNSKSIEDMEIDVVEEYYLNDFNVVELHSESDPGVSEQILSTEASVEDNLKLTEQFLFDEKSQDLLFQSHIDVCNNVMKTDDQVENSCIIDNSKNNIFPSENYNMTQCSSTITNEDENPLDLTCFEKSNKIQTNIPGQSLDNNEGKSENLNNTKLIPTGNEHDNKNIRGSNEKLKSIDQYLFYPEQKKENKSRRFNKHQNLPSVLTGKVYRDWLIEEERKKKEAEESKKLKRQIKADQLKVKKEIDELKPKKKLLNEKIQLTQLQIKEKSAKLKILQKLKKGENENKENIESEISNLNKILDEETNLLSDLKKKKSECLIQEKKLISEKAGKRNINKD